MVPLQTHQGLDAFGLAALVRGRPVLVWGTGDLAQDVVTFVIKAGLSVAALLHTRPDSAVSIRLNLPIHNAESVLTSGAGELFVILATPAYRSQAAAACERAGLVRNVDFITHMSLPRAHAVIELVGHCPLKCLGCIQQTRGPMPMNQLMDSASFHRVLNKLLSDIPLLVHLDLALNGEPLLHPELPAMIARAQQSVPCTVSTGMGASADLEAILRAGPSRFDITASGFADSYEKRSGASWNRLLQQLDNLRQLIPEYSARTRFRLRLYRHRGDGPELVEYWRDLLKESGIALSVEMPYVMPYDEVLRHAAGIGMSAPAAQAVAALPWNFTEALALSSQDRGRPCLSQRIFPVIRADRSVGLCHLYDEPRVAADYLAVDWVSLLAQRHSAPACCSCQLHGLHRLDIDVLSGNYPDRRKALFTS